MHAIARAASAHPALVGISLSTASWNVCSANKQTVRKNKMKKDPVW
jgi:hypothetical protein